MDPAVAPLLDPPTPEARFALSGVVGDWLDTVVENWLLPYPRANPAMIQMFRDRDRRPARKLMMWSGEFAGKYLLGALGVWQQTGDPRLRTTIDGLVAELIATQGPDGYLGPFPPEERLIVDNWDLWGHYHVMYALLRYAALAAFPTAQAAAERAAALIMATFGRDRATLVYGQQMNLGIAHAMLMLYEATGEAQYLDWTRWLIAAEEAEPKLGLVRGMQEGREFYQLGPEACRWEVLHFVQALARLHWLTGAPEYRETVTRLWDSIRRRDRHNTGGFSTAEQAVGSPYALGAIEHCCTVAWAELTFDMLRLTGDSAAADELELTLYNAAMGGMHPSGRWWTYDTPMDGLRRSASDQIVFQAHPGGPELNCCTANAARPLALVRQWAALTFPGGVALNYYGPGAITLPLPAGGEVTLTQETAYPLEGAVALTVTPDQAREFTLRLRIPAWSHETRLRLNDEPVRVEAGEYLSLTRIWAPGDRVELDLDFRLRYAVSREVPLSMPQETPLWEGEFLPAGLVCLYRGPLLLAYDQRLNEFDPEEVPAVHVERLNPRRLPTEEAPSPAPLLRLAVDTVVGKPLILCDFASAGAGGNPYRTWLPAEGADPSHEGPLA
jgi:DUF1680 family protein